MTSLRDRLRDVPAPEPVLSREREAALTDRAAALGQDREQEVPRLEYRG